MKFVIAAGILSQTLLPIATEGSAGLLSNAKQLKLQLQDALLQDPVQQDPGRPSARFQAIKAARAKKRSQRFPSGELKNDPADVVVHYSTPDLAFEMEYCDPASEDPDVGVLTCGPGRVCKPSQKSLFGGVCADRTTKTRSRGGKNKAKKDGKSHQAFKALKNGAAYFSVSPSVVSTMACDPKSDDPDVGVLSCDVDSFCESSPASVLGGLCVAPAGSSSRALQTVHPYCDPESDYYSLCDCSGYDISTGTGDVVCTRPSYCLNNVTFGSCGDDTCCDETCGNLVRSVNYANSSVTSGDLCFAWSTPYPQEACLGWIEDPSGILPTECYATFDDQDCLCEVEFDNQNAYVFDCSAVGGPAGSDIDGTSPFFLMPIVESCYEYLPSCNLCNDIVEGYIPYANYNITVGDGITCGDIRNAVCFCDSARTVFGDSPTCQAYQELAEVYCCSDGSPSGPCDLCPGSYMDPAQENASIADPGFESYNCGFASDYVEVNNVGTYECSIFQTVVSSTCCAAPGSGSAAPTDAPGPGSIAPTDAPGPGSTTPTNAPGSGSTTPTGAPGPGSTTPTDAPGPGSTTPTGAPEPGADAPSQSPTSDGAYGRMSKNAVVSSLFSAILSLALLFLS